MSETHDPPRDGAVPPAYDVAGTAGASARSAARATPSRRREARPEPVQEFFSIGEVCALTDLRPHVLRYWETQFKILSPAKNRSGNRVYARREVERLLLVRQLLYAEKYTIDGARQRLEAQRRSGELRAAARDALARETLGGIERELRDILDVLEGRRLPGAPGEQGG